MINIEWQKDKPQYPYFKTFINSFIKNKKKIIKNFYFSFGHF